MEDKSTAEIKQKSTTQKNNEKKKDSRRIFLKKIAYSAPTIIIIGELLKPQSAHADYSGGPVGPPGW